METNNKNNIIEKSLNNIKSKYILKKIVDNLIKAKLLKLIKYNKLLKERLELGIIDYKNNFEQIEIELIPIVKKDKNIFINFTSKKGYYHIYFNNEVKEIKRYYFTRKDNVKKIKVIIDNEVKSLEKLFQYCNCIEKINFIKFNREDINNMNCMFSGCVSLKDLNINNFKTDNVINMSWMFSGCHLLNILNVSKFNTKNVKDMSRMFFGCLSLKELNLDNFDTSKVILYV